MRKCEGLTTQRLYRISKFKFYFLGHTNYNFSYKGGYTCIFSTLALPLRTLHHPRTVHHFCSTHLRDSCLGYDRDLSLIHLYYELKDERGSCDLTFYPHLIIK